MSCAITVDAVLARTKTVTRRHAKTWGNLKPGDHLTLIEKGMGLPKGAKQVVLAQVEIVSNTLEPLGDIDQADCIAEGFPHFTPDEFVEMWCASHHETVDEAYDKPVRRIEWRYLDDVPIVPAPVVIRLGASTDTYWPETTVGESP